MSDFKQFELVEDPAPTTKGFELRINVARHTSVREGEISISNGCTTFGEFTSEVERLKSSLDELLIAAKKRFK